LRVFISYTTSVWNIFHYENSARYDGLHVKYPLFLIGFNDTNFLEILEKHSFHDNPSTGSQVVPCRQTVEHKVISRFLHFVKSAYNCTLSSHCIWGFFYLFRKWRLLSYITQTNGLSDPIVYCAVRTGSLNKTVYASTLNG
jgi:hypothetical protein